MRQPVRVVLADDHDAFVEGLGMVLSAEGDLEVVALAGDGASALEAVRTHRPDVLVVDTQMPGPAVADLVRLVGQARPTTRVLLLAEDTRPAAPGRPAPGGHAGMTRAVSARQLAEAIRAVAAGHQVAPPDPPATHPPTSPATSPATRPPTSPATRPAAPSPGHGSPQPRVPGAPEREGSRPPGGAVGAVHSPHSPGGSHSQGSPGRAGRPGSPGSGGGPGRPGSAGSSGGAGSAGRPGSGGGLHSSGGFERTGRDEHAELLLRSLSERERQVLAMLARGWSNRRIAETCFLSLNTVRTHVQNVLVKLGVHSKLEAAALAVRQGLVSIEDHPA